MSLLLQEHPQLVPPGLAQVISIIDAIVLHQVHNLVARSKNIWINNMYEELQNKISFWRKSNEQLQ